MAYRIGLDRGWFFVSTLLARFLPEARGFPIFVSGLGSMIVNFSEGMCFPAISKGYVFGSEVKLLKNILRQGDVVYDIGANYGLTAVYSAQKIGNKGQVIALLRVRR